MDPTNVGFLKWLDPYEKMEKGSHKEENTRFRKVLDNSISKKDLDNLKEKYKLYKEEGEPEIILEYPERNPKVFFKYESKWKFSKGNWHDVDNMDISKDGEIVAYTYASLQRNENYRMAIRGRFSWTHKNFGGPHVAILGSRIFFIEGDKLLHYTRLVSMNLEGGDRKVIYEEESKLLELVRCESRTLFLLASDGGIQSLFHLTESGINQLSPKGVSFYPIGPGPAYFVREGNFSAPWKLVGEDWKLNSRIRADGIEFCSVAAKILITKFYGVRTIWKMDGRDPLKLYSGVFEILPCTNFMGWLGITDKLYCNRPGSSVYTLNLKTMIESPVLTYGGTLRTGISISSDNLPVRWALLGSERPTGIVCISYGSYGVATSLKTTRWRAWIDAGWAIAFLFIRGGGDGNEMWADLGRLGGKKTEFDDVEACVKDLQRLTRCKPINTVLFGRSAGGLVVGNLAARWPRGELAGIIYSEVPYVDLLKTAANPKAPLTPYEYKEFGNPRAGLIDFETALEISPIHQLEPRGAPGIKVLCRTGTADVQVFPYESLKWITALRGGRKDDTKVLYIDNEGHRSNKAEIEYAEDFAIINGWNPVIGMC